MACNRIILCTGYFRRRTQISDAWELIFSLVHCLVIVVGSLIGQWMGVMQKLGLLQNFWFGHQGYEYVDLGRFWQLFLFVGLDYLVTPDGTGYLACYQTKIGKPQSSGTVS